MLNDTPAAVVVNRNGGDLVVQCLRSLGQGSLVPQVIVVVDNNSTDGSDQRIEEQFPQVQVLRNRRNVGYGAGLNQGIQKLCQSDLGLLLLMNNDVIVGANAVEVLVKHWRPRAGMLGPKVFRLDGAGHLDAAWGEILFNHVGCRMVGEGSLDTSEFSQVRSVDALLGCMLLTSCAVVSEAGPFDPDYFMYLEEVDYAHRIRKLGKEVLFVPDAHVWHAGGHATNEHARKAVKVFYVRRNTVLLLRKHGNLARWCKFFAFSGASLLFCLLTFRWHGFQLRFRGYVAGLHAQLHLPFDQRR